MHAIALGVVAHPIEQHGLAHASQPDQQNAFCGTTKPQALQANMHLLANLVAARQLRRRSASTRCIGIPYRIHLVGTLASLCSINKLYLSGTFAAVKG
ncbi:MAG: hypothetical protein ACTHJZ_23150 [Trinickia sp.]